MGICVSTYSEKVTVGIPTFPRNMNMNEKIEFWKNDT